MARGEHFHSACVADCTLRAIGTEFARHNLVFEQNLRRLGLCKNQTVSICQPEETPMNMNVHANFDAEAHPFLKTKLGHVIDGRVFKSALGQVFDTLNPAMGKMLARLAEEVTPSTSTGQISYQASPPKLRALAVAHDKRLAVLPDVPTFAKMGLKKMETSS
jgi:hypothetical protein